MKGLCLSERRSEAAQDREVSAHLTAPRQSPRRDAAIGSPFHFASGIAKLGVPLNLTPCDINMSIYRVFTVKVKTGDRHNAGTDANVFIRLTDERGKVSPSIKLDNPDVNDFERGKTNTFNVVVEDDSFGSPVKLNISHDDSGEHSGWYLDEVIVSDAAGWSVNFPGYRWLSRENGGTSADLVPSVDPIQLPNGTEFHL